MANGVSGFVFLWMQWKKNIGKKKHKEKKACECNKEDITRSPTSGIYILIKLNTPDVNAVSKILLAISPKAVLSVLT